MLSESRISSATKQFLQTLNEISNEVISYYFDSATPTDSFKKKQHVIQLYTFVYANCTTKPSYEEKMFEAFKSALLKHMIKYMDFLNERLKTNKVIQCYNLIWDSYIAFLKLLSKRIFTYLDRYYVPANDLDSLIKVGLGVFMKTFLAQSNIKVFISPYAQGLDQIRSSKIINNDDLLKFSESFVILDSANLFRILKEIYLMEAENYYKKVFEEHCNDQPMAYLNYVNNLRYFELVMAKKCICLTEAEQVALCELFNTQLIKRYNQIFCCHPYGFTYLLRNKRRQQLKFVGDLYQKNEGFGELKKFLNDFIIEEGNVVLNDKSKHASSQQFVNQIYQLYRSYQKLISQSFSEASEMLGCFNNAFEKIMSKFDRIIEDLFKFTRLNLDTGTFETVSDKVVAVFQKLPYKDQFFALYKRSLQTKILSGTAIYLIEKTFIETLNKICNNETTSHLSKILQDSIQSTPKIETHNFQIKVVYLHLWQKNYKDQLSLNLTLNQPIQSTWVEYQRQYMELYPKRTLILLPIQTKLVLKVFSFNKEMTIKCNLLQACIIFYVANRKDPVNESNIIQDLSLEKSILHRFVQQFPNIITDDENGNLFFNWSFETVDHVVDLQTKVEEEKKVIKHIKQDRDVLVQFAIVRIAKKRKRLSFEQMVQQIVQQTRLFKPHPSMIKSCIQVMKKKEYIQEDQQGMICYKQ